MTTPKNLGMKVLAAWLVLTGIIPLVNFSFNGLGTIMAIGAIVAGVLIFLGK